MQLETPYKTPSTMDAAVEEVATYTPKVFASEGRIGRLRFLVYSFLYQFLLTLVIAVSVGVITAIYKSGIGDIPILIGALIALAAIVSIWVALVPVKRRLHDMNCSAWWAIIYFIPVIQFIFYLVLLFAPGTAMSNQFGPKPDKNSVPIIVFGLIFPLLTVGVGVAAALAIPAYNDYVQRVQPQ
ncbi:DUF805 domain-containing protein [Zooshikella harenae]|uniref:DUF805 domain-containing protein n=1 Tax=Zooshikella harenae TaxID=2827238 RepID=A0ABS5ZI00_9GAMM|nr:DUF805 domain-containing protein [Zooshikella harenae]MBU2713488.1 DUF805 domain-containing protein [Zooshikella harenae]